MRIFVLFVLFLFVTVLNSYEQNIIAVQNGGNSTFYSNLDSAIFHSLNGDTVYIPGGIYTITSEITKQLHFIGTGHNPDSTQATSLTAISGGLHLRPNSNGSSFTGLSFPYAVYTSESDEVNNITITRCNIVTISLPGHCSNWSITENVIKGNMHGSINVSTFLLANNIIEASCSNLIPFLTNSTLKNNIFLVTSYCNYGCTVPINASNCTFENNIFLSNSSYYSVTNSVSNSVFMNNIFVENWNPNSPTTNVSINNIINQPINEIFVNQQGPLFSYTQDYHLQPTCPGKNTGTDGTDIGIYGGSFIWKDGSVPFNPHIQVKQISGTTNSSGNLPVNIKVSAQDH